MITEFLHRLRRIFTCTLLLIGALCMPGCTPLNDFRELTDIDFQPPMLLTVETDSNNRFRIQFTEPVQAVDGSFHCTLTESETELAINSISFDVMSTLDNGRGSRILVETAVELSAGARALLEGEVSDKSGNTLFFSAAVYGWNESVPQLIITEFTTQGSSRHPDRVEIMALSDGNIAGVTFIDGVNEQYRQRKILPPISIKQGEYIVIHCAEESAIGVDETTDTSESDAATAVDSAWDIWIDEAIGLSGNNGIITLYSSPRGELMDAVLYSNRTSQSDTSYLGFGSKSLMQRVEILEAQTGWMRADTLSTDSESEEILIEPSLETSIAALRPQDGVNPDDSTATRSMCRKSMTQDTDTLWDWYIVPTSQSSFGLENSTEVYAVPESE